MNNHQYFDGAKAVAKLVQSIDPKKKDLILGGLSGPSCQVKTAALRRYVERMSPQVVTVQLERDDDREEFLQAFNSLRSPDRLKSAAIGQCVGVDPGGPDHTVEYCAVNGLYFRVGHEGRMPA